MVKLKIVGVVNDYKEAESIEDIVKVFVIEKRISSLLSDDKNKNYENIETNTMILDDEEVKNLGPPDEITEPKKNIDKAKPLFNVRGLN